MEKWIPRMTLLSKVLIWLIILSNSLIISLCYSNEPLPVLTILYTGEQVGYLEPCGCSNPQLGGLPRRDTFIKSLEPDRVNLLLIDNGDITSGYGRQEELKHEISILSLKEMDYFCINVGEGDLMLGYRYLKYIEDTQGIPLLSANIVLGSLTYLSEREDTSMYPFKPYLIKNYGVGERTLKVGITGIVSKSFEEDIKRTNEDLSIQEPIEALKPVISKLEEYADVIILLAHMNENEAKEIAKHFPSIDIIITGHGNNEPSQVPVEIDNCIMLSSGMKGRYIGRAKVVFNGSGEVIKESEEGIPLSDRFQASKPILKLLGYYQEMLKNEGLLSRIKKEPLNDENYVSNQRCKICHGKALRKWEESRHAKAYETLMRKGREFDPECVGCHVTGLKHESGFKSIEETLELANVGCESCHGPGSKHIENFQEARVQAMETIDIGSSVEHERYGRVREGVCRACHTQEKSPGFDYEMYLEKIRHER